MNISDNENFKMANILRLWTFQRKNISDNLNIFDDEHLR